MNIIPDGKDYKLIVSNEEKLIIDWMRDKQPRKLERFIEDYLKTRENNRKVYEDKEMIKNMTEGEKTSIKSRMIS